MPSPFPGMDPYLEGSYWTSVHTELTVEIARQLSPLLRPRYLALPTRRFVMEAPKGIEVTAPIPHVTVEIQDIAQRQLVTAIEVLSPTNKRGEGRDEYLAKRQQLLRSTAHLTEIDLLREGTRVHAELPSAAYFVFLRRSDSRRMCEVWPIALESPLPTVPVPLLPGDADVVLDLQQALTAVYDVFSYDLAIDYTKPPEVPLDPEAAAWADERLRAAGLRH